MTGMDDDWIKRMREREFDRREREIENRARHDWHYKRGTVYWESADADRDRLKWDRFHNSFRR